MNITSSLFNRSRLSRRPALAALALMAVLPLATQAQVTVEASADAYLRSYGTNATTNYGNGTYLQVKGGGDIAYARKGIIRFDFTGSNGAGAVDNSSITLTVLAGAGNSPSDTVWNFAIYGLDGTAAGQDWVEGTGETGVSGPTPPNAVTWNNAPGNNTLTTYSTDSATTTLVGTFTVTGKGTNGDTVTVSGDALDNFLSTVVGSQYVSFLIVRTDTSGGVDASETVVHQFASRENTTYDAPKLSYTNIPEASSTALMAGLLILGTLAFRRYKCQ
ncbi:hypothetical protein H5P28_03140 [Ruficoccus amylovorans]|uniref:Carbohydrate-binding module family 96 domain-containing protein n=1 Tax=Ruficoccus amylovorans TaxID=1804625 RepID=A0A842HB01_9BACT|nr:hypothetical protein [Ruficoccus amylovorans]MBC2593248.1 hypothetical protein [Ruficoccus amylovorans]